MSAVTAPALANCNSNDIFVSNDLLGITHTTETDGWIEADNHIDANADITYKSPISITLFSDFEVRLNSLFHAYINNCGVYLREEQSSKKSLKQSGDFGEDDLDKDVVKD